MDGTHIQIDPPKRSKDDYINRKKIISICLQAICDANRKFIDICVGYPGSVHDSRVFENSDIYQRLPNACGNYIILADSAYRCTQYVLTPYRDNGRMTREQKKFNMVFSSGRVIVEHSFGNLKNKFRQLRYCKLRGVDKICHFVRACVVLHNMIDGQEPFDEENQEPVDVNNEEVYDGPDLAGGAALRNQLCAQLFGQI